MSHPVRILFGHWVAALLLAVIALQATPAQAIAHVPDRGPAFSAASLEVALAPRRDLAAETRVAPVPLPARPQTGRAPLRAPLPVALPWPANRQTGPPQTPPKRALASPREPPLS